MYFNKKRNKDFFNKELLYKTLGIVFLVGICVLIIADIKMYQKKQELNSQINNYKKQIEDIKKSSQTLQDEIANADNKDYLEKLGYEQFGQARPGETEYMFVKSQKTTEVTSPQKNFWVQLFNWIKSKF